MAKSRRDLQTIWCTCKTCWLRSACAAPDQALLADGSVVPLTEEARAAIMERVDAMASDALRCLAFAQKTDLGEFAAYDGDTHHPVRPLSLFLHDGIC